jgi:hypothetical protein
MKLFDGESFNGEQIRICWIINSQRAVLFSFLFITEDRGGQCWSRRKLPVPSLKIEKLKAHSCTPSLHYHPVHELRPTSFIGVLS